MYYNSFTLVQCQSYTCTVAVLHHIPRSYLIDSPLGGAVTAPTKPSQPVTSLFGSDSDDDMFGSSKPAVQKEETKVTLAADKPTSKSDNFTE